VVSSSVGAEPPAKPPAEPPAETAKVPSPLFPLPSPDGKPLVAKEDQKQYRVPLRLRAVELFYRDRFDKTPGVTLTVTKPQGPRTLTLKSTRKGDDWTRAIIREGEMETVIDITPVIRVGEEKVTGTARPLVEFILPRSDLARKMSEQIDHVQR